MDQNTVCNKWNNNNLDLVCLRDVLELGLCYSLLVQFLSECRCHRMVKVRFLEFVVAGVADAKDHAVVDPNLPVRRRRQVPTPVSSAPCKSWHLLHPNHVPAHSASIGEPAGSGGGLSKHDGEVREAVHSAWCGIPSSGSWTREVGCIHCPLALGRLWLVPCAAECGEPCLVAGAEEEDS
ncbi:hypothetical protein SEVIR_1G358051v4 [Setaria viridis]